MILAFDTSTAFAGVALYGETGVLAEANWRSHRDQTAQLLPMAHKLLALESVTPDQLTGIAVATGPGSFNGLRVAVSTGKGMALALGLPLFSASSLDILAYQHSFINGTLCTVLEAGRGRLGAGFYKVRNGAWKRNGDYENLTVEELIARIETSGTTTIAGELNADQTNKLTEKFGKQLILLPPAAALRRSGALAEMAWKRLQSGDSGDDIANLQPIYLHQPVS